MASASSSGREESKGRLIAAFRISAATHARLSPLRWLFRSDAAHRALWGERAQGAKRCAADATAKQVSGSFWSLAALSLSRVFIEQNWKRLASITPPSKNDPKGVPGKIRPERGGKCAEGAGSAVPARIGRCGYGSSPFPGFLSKSAKSRARGRTPAIPEDQFP